MYQPYFEADHGRMCIYEMRPGRKKRRIFYSRHVMQQHLGRRLEWWEEVHHIDENVMNDALENLEVRTKWEHTAHHMKGNTYGIGNRAKFTQHQVDALRAEWQAQKHLVFANDLAKKHGMATTTYHRVVVSGIGYQQRSE